MDMKRLNYGYKFHRLYYNFKQTIIFHLMRIFKPTIHFFLVFSNIIMIIFSNKKLVEFYVQDLIQLDMLKLMPFKYLRSI